MKKNIALYFFISVLLGLWACKKEAGISVTDLIQIDSATLRNGVINTDLRDTTTVSLGNVQAKFSQTSTCFPGKEIFSFTASGVKLPSGGYYHWSFGDGNIADGSMVTYSYQAPGSFVVTLEVMLNTNNVLAKMVFPIKAKGQQTKPEASFSFKSDFPNNLNYITFNSSSSVNHSDIIQYKYEWGDGSSLVSSIGLIRHEFPKKINDTTYPVKLTITTNTGCSDDTTMPVLIPGTYNIKGSFKAVAFEACTNENFIFTAEAEHVPTGAVYEWDFSDGKGSKIGNPVQYKYKYPNDYDVMMSVKLNGREIYRTNKLVRSKGENPKPIASFEETLVWNYLNTQRWSFNSRSTIATSTIDTYKWDFGNGNTNNEFNSFIETVFNKANTAQQFKVQLIVTGNGCADTTSKIITIPKM
jgi:hypothetical protein